MGGDQARARFRARVADDALDDARLADGQPDACTSSWTIALGESAELLATRYEIPRERQDEFALASHRNAAKGWDDGFL